MEVERRAFAATWRDEETGEIVGTTLGDTMCWRPRRPWAMISVGDDWSFALRCGDCPGCYEFQRRELTKRLHQKYGAKAVEDSHTAELGSNTPRPERVRSREVLYNVRIWAPADLHFYFARKLHRRRGLELEPGMFRLGRDSFALLARSKSALLPLLRRLGLRHSVEPIRLSRGRRAWRRLTLGLLVARSVYGEQVKRWYMRGLPKAAKLRWDVVKHAMQKPWRRRTGARVRAGGKLILVPPEIWSLGCDRLKEYRESAAAAVSPEQAIRNRRRLAEIVGGAASALRLTAPAEPALTREQVRTFYATMVQRKRARASETPMAALSPSTLLGGGLQSSRHSFVPEGTHDAARELETWLHSGAPPPVEGREREYEDWLDECWSDGRTRRAIMAERATSDAAIARARERRKDWADIDSWLERMKSKIRGG